MYVSTSTPDGAVYKLGVMMDKCTCVKCGESFPKPMTWIEIGPCTGRPVRVCDACYTTQQNAREHVVMRVHFIERMTTLDVVEVSRNVYAYRATYHFFDGHVQNEFDVSEFDMEWIRTTFAHMNVMYDNLNAWATETYMDMDEPCNQ